MSLKVIIVGGVAAGPKAAAKIARLDPTAEVTIIEKGNWVSYAGCGLPYYVSGAVKHQELMCTPNGVLRDAGYFLKVKNVKVLLQTEVFEIDRLKKRVRIRHESQKIDTWLPYDVLVLATGAKPLIPPLPNVALRNVTALYNEADANAVLSILSQKQPLSVAIIGGGLIGVETVEALVHRGCRVTLIETLPHILRKLDWEMARLVEKHIESKGVRIFTQTQVIGFRGYERVTSVLTNRGSLAVDLVILATGLKPNADLARAAGLEIGPTGGIKVDEGMRTSDTAIYAAGDCVENHHLITGQPCYAPMGSTASKQGRIAALNICGGHDRFPGVLESTVCRVFDYCVARTGLTEAAARELGYQVSSVIVPDVDRPHYMPLAKPITIKLVVDANSRKILGGQAIGAGEGAKRIDVVAMAITAGMSVDQLSKVDLCYAPPFAPAMDNIITAANVARNKLDGEVIGVTPMEVKRKL